MLEREEKIKQDLIKRFSALEAGAAIPRQKRVRIEVTSAHFREVLEYAAKTLKCSHFCTVTGLDEGENLSAIYHLAQDTGIMLNIKTSVPKNNPVLPTVTDLFPTADAGERELIDLFGFKIEGLAPGNRYPLPDNWPKGEYPLRKDWKKPAAKEEGK